MRTARIWIVLALILLSCVATRAAVRIAPKPAKQIPHKTAATAKPAPSKICPLFLACDDFRYGFIDKTGKVVSSGYEDAGDYSEGLAVVKLRGQCGYADASGKLVIAAQYDWAGKFSEGLAPVRVGKLCGFTDKTGKTVIEPKYGNASEFSEGLAVVSIDGKCGAIDNTGTIVIKPTYEAMGPMSDGLMAVSDSGKWGYIDKNGLTVIESKFDKVDRFVGGLAPAWSGRKCGFIDKTGKWVIEAKYDDELPFSDGLAAVAVTKTDVVRKDGKVVAMKRYLLWGYIDPTGAEVIPISLKTAGSFSEGWAPVTKGNMTGFIDLAGIPAPAWKADEFSFIDKTGKTALVPLYSAKTLGFHGGLARTEIGPRYGFIDDTGKMIVPQRYTTATPFNEGLAAVQIQTDGPWGYIDGTGNMAIQPQFQSALGFRNGYARAKIDYKWGLIDKTGAAVLKPQFDGIAWYTDKILSVNMNQQWGFYDWSGKAILEPQFDSASFLGDSQAIVKKNGKYGVVDSTGKLIIPAQYDDCGWLFAQGLLPVSTNGKFGFIDTTGKTVIDPQYDSAVGFTSDGLSAVKVGDMWGFIDKTGKMAIAPQYDVATSFSEGCAAVKAGDLWGFIDKTGQYIVKPQYADASYFSCGLAPVCTGDKWGYIDKTGSLVIPVKFDRAAAFQNNLAQLRKGRQTGYIDKTGKTIWMSKDYGETVAKAKISEPAQYDADGARVLKVRIAPDQIEQRQPDWESMLRKRVADASDILKKAKIRLEIVGITPWESPEQKDGEDPDDWGERMFSAMEKQAPAEDSELVLGFTGRPPTSHRLGFTYAFWDHIFIYQQEDQAPPAMVTAHEICHTFGAFHVEPKDSLMHYCAEPGVDQTSIDQYTARQLEIVHDFDHAKGIDSLTKDQIDGCAANFADGHTSGDTFCVIQSLVGRGSDLVGTDLPGAITEFRKAAAVPGQPPDFTLIAKLGEALQFDGQLVQSAEMFRKSEPLPLEQTVTAKGHRLLGGKLEGLISDEIAFIGCQQPTKPTLAEIYERRVRARVSSDEMLSQYREAVKAEPENDYCHFRLGKALLLCGLNDEAVGEYQKAIDLKPGNQWYGTQLELAKEQIAAQKH